MKYIKDKDEFFSKPIAKRIMVNTLSQNLQNYWQRMGYLGYVANGRKLGNE